MIFKNKKGGNTGTLALMLIIMLSINIGLAFTQTGVNSITEQSNTLGDFNTENTPYNNYITGDLTTGTSNINSNLLPSDEAVTGDTGNIITDTYTSSKTWFKKDLTGVSFMTNLFNQPRGFLVAVGIPNAIATAIQVLWGMLAVIFTAAFIFGRN